MKLVSWNVNGLRAAIKKDFISQIRLLNADIIGLQETKLQLDQIPNEMNELSDYYIYWHSAVKKGYSGVALLTKIEPIQVTYSMEKEEFDCEGRFICAEYKDFYLLNIYFPNGQMSEERLQYKLAFYNHTLDLMEKLRSERKGVVVCGDFNTAHHPIDLKNPKQNEDYSGFLPIERKWLDLIEEKGYVDTFRHLYPNDIKYSWWSYRFQARQKNIGWRIDYFYISQEVLPRLENTFILNEIEGSDHCPVGVILS